MFTRYRPGTRDALEISVPISEVWRNFLPKSFRGELNYKFQLSTYIVLVISDFNAVE